MAIAASSAQAANFDISIIEWYDGDVPPADPDTNDVAHFQFSDAVKTVYSNSFSFMTSGTGFAGYTGQLRVDFYNADSGGGFGLISYPDSLPDYAGMANGGALTVETAPVLYTGTLDTPQIKTGVFDMIDVYHTDIHYRVTIAEGGVPEPATWAMMVGGFGLVGATMRGRKRIAVRFA
ncbi:MAG TPA: PEPxxWA-CTERM sorting domain-containing protein [Sphingomonas sp.]|nr:PEPxxWA-CTERM sorting domain-containing protein [Sphingomonas sp.]HMI18528.1 PEPxxWA-CTERM sorting domain-containing protein [Sphingomonas sp.]